MNNFDQHFFKNITDLLVEESSVELTLVIPPDLPYFEGHFKDNPILPGIISIEVSSWLIIKYFKLEVSSYTSIKKTKFKNIIKPNDKVHISIKKKPQNQEQYTLVWSLDNKKLLELTLFY